MIENISTASTCGWGNQPLPGHLNKTDRIERIQHSNNNLVDNCDIGLSQVK
jgi:hypothetical protein